MPTPVKKSIPANAPNGAKPPVLGGLKAALAASAARSGVEMEDASASPRVLPVGVKSDHEPDERDTRPTRDFSGWGVIGDVAGFLRQYVVLPDQKLLVASAWVVAAHLGDVWDRFPHLAITSPEKRCGKTRFLQLLEPLLPNPHNTANISPAAIWRLIEKYRPTLLLDEAQSINRLGSEAAEVTRELLNSAIDRNAKVIRCVGKDHDPKPFSVYCPKVVALIGALDGVLADRCLPVEMKRKTEADVVQQYRSRVAGPEAAALLDQLLKWVEENRERVTKVYDTLNPFDIENDRMAELLMPLQAVVEVAEGTRAIRAIRAFQNGAEVLREYAETLDARDKEEEMQSPGVRLLTACRDVFAPATGQRFSFLPTDELIKALVDRSDEPWGRWSKGEKITREALATLLRPYGIKPSLNKKQTHRGYHASDFEEEWGRYLPVGTPKNPV